MSDPITEPMRLLLASVVAKNVPEAYQQLVTDTVAPFLAEVTADNIASVVQDIVTAIVNKNEVAAYAVILGLESEEQIAAEGDAANLEMADMQNKKLARDKKVATGMTNFITGLLYILIAGL